MPWRIGRPQARCKVGVAFVAANVLATALAMSRTQSWRRPSWMLSACDRVGSLRGQRAVFARRPHLWRCGALRAPLETSDRQADGSRASCCISPYNCERLCGDVWCALSFHVRPSAATTPQTLAPWDLQLIDGLSLDPQRSCPGMAGGIHGALRTKAASCSWQRFQKCHRELATSTTDGRQGAEHNTHGIPIL